MRRTSGRGVELPRHPHRPRRSWWSSLTRRFHQKVASDWSVWWWRMAGRSPGPLSGSRSRGPLPIGGWAATARSAGLASSTVPAAPPQPTADAGAAGPQGRPSAADQTPGPVQIGARLGMAASTVHRVLCRLGLNRLAWMDRATGIPVRRYEHAHPGSLVHVDIKKLGNIPAGGGHRVHGRQLGDRHSQADRSSGRFNAWHNPIRGYGFVTPPSMTTPGWPMSKSIPMSWPPPPAASGREPRPGSPSAASWSSGC